MNLGINIINKKQLRMVIIFSSFSFFIISISCKRDNKRNNFKTENNFKQELRLINDDFLIYEKGVSALKIGENLPKEINDYKFFKSHKLAEEGSEEPIIEIFHDKNKLFEVSFFYDSENQRFNDKIFEILVKNQKFKTQENIGVLSTIEDFTKAYPNYFIWYTYISNSYIIQSKDLKIQFMLDEKGFVSNKNLMDGDMVELELKDFKLDTKITEIRIF
jgi:hypothetical protein